MGSAAATSAAAVTWGRPHKYATPGNTRMQHRECRSPKRMQHGGQQDELETYRLLILPASTLLPHRNSRAPHWHTFFGESGKGAFISTVPGQSYRKLCPHTPALTLRGNQIPIHRSLAFSCHHHCLAQLSALVEIASSRLFCPSNNLYQTSTPSKIRKQCSHHSLLFMKSRAMMKAQRSDSSGFGGDRVPDTTSHYWTVCCRQKTPSTAPRVP